MVDRLFISVRKPNILVIQFYILPYANALLAEKSELPVSICQEIMANLLANATIALCLPRLSDRH